MTAVSHARGSPGGLTWILFARLVAALRLICFAHRDAADLSLGTSEEEFAQLCNSGMTCDAIVGILDPPRSDVKDAVKKAQGAGIKVRMVTGDHVNTAKEIGSRAGIYREGDVALEGPEFRKMTPAAVDNILDKLTVRRECSNAPSVFAQYTALRNR